MDIFFFDRLYYNISLYFGKNNEVIVNLASFQREHIIMKSIVLRLALSLSLVFSLAVHADPARVAAAADLKFVLEELAQAFEKQGGGKPAVTYGSSGAITAQISNGAPFELFLSADEEYVARLNSGGFTRDEGVLYATGHLVIVAPKQSALEVDPELKGLQAALQAGKLQRFAIANPEHAPYGRRAVEVLKHAGIWDQIQPKLVLGENVAQAAQFATSGSTDGGIVALSLVKSPQLANTVKYAEIPESWHSPQRQRMVLLKNSGENAKAFYDFLQQPAARQVFRRYGFVLPGE